MTYQQYCDEVQKVGHFVDVAKDYPSAVVILQRLLDSDLPDVDKSLMSHNMAIVCEKMGNDDHAIQWFDYGIALESQYMRSQVRIEKAQFFIRKNRNAEAKEILLGLLDEPSLAFHLREQIRGTLATL
jgi:hypothetical protein